MHFLKSATGKVSPSDRTVSRHYARLATDSHVDLEDKQGEGPKPRVQYNNFMEADSSSLVSSKPVRPKATTSSLFIQNALSIPAASNSPTLDSVAENESDDEAIWVTNLDTGEVLNYINTPPVEKVWPPAIPLGEPLPTRINTPRNISHSPASLDSDSKEDDDKTVSWMNEAEQQRVASKAATRKGRSSFWYSSLGSSKVSKVSPVSVAFDEDTSDHGEQKRLS